MWGDKFLHNGKSDHLLNRRDGPSIEYDDGTKVWIVKGKPKFGEFVGNRGSMSCCVWDEEDGWQSMAEPMIPRSWSWF